METIQEGKAYYFYDDRATDSVCKAHVLHILPHPESNNNKLIVYRWYGKHRRRWWYGVTTLAIQEIWDEYCQKFCRLDKERRDKARAKKCGKCGYFMRYINYKGQPSHLGDCANIQMNKECYDGINPFNDEDEQLLQVEENETACNGFKENMTKRVMDYINEHPSLYVQATHFKPKKSR